MFGEPTARDREFDAVIAAVARLSKRRNIAHQAEPKKLFGMPGKLHEKALLKRRKRKRGGPK